MSTMGAASPDTITSPCSKWVITAAFVDQEAAISMMGRLEHSQPATLLNAHPSSLLLEL